MDNFDIALIVLGGLLVVGALLSGVAKRSFLSLTALYVLAGFALGEGGLGVLQFSADSGFVKELAILALVVILFRDGLEVESELLATQWHLPLRKLVVAMPITAAIITLAGHLIAGLSWLEAGLLGALLSPTDPVLSSAVVTNPRVPRLIRNSLNLESGLNDGLALALIIPIAAALNGTSDGQVWWQFMLEDMSIGFVAGIAIGYVASMLIPRPSDLDGAIPDHHKVLYALGVAFLTYGLLSLAGHGNAFIAVYVCAITLGVRRGDIRDYFSSGAEEIVELVKLGIFVVFGSILTVQALFESGWAAVAIVVVTLTVARTAGVWLSLIGNRERLSTQTKAFMSWFGPKGVATMTYSLFLLALGIPGATEVTNLAALCVVTSIIAHGLTDTPGANWIGRRAAAAREKALATGTPVPPDAVV
ncbi:MAG: hypothetical protein F2813_06185 [Actinobacteria bacterium]|uniref:Unannotated protein n=1 Tax=freshwater metagenome TaxID=449393 RepID=A0A6J5ZXE2_9ZZZZ|nr:hypothetical protein [Actinomycetota bacterium]